MSVEVNLEDRAFRLISGHRALDLLATLRDRHRQATECLRVPSDLDRWLAVAALDVEMPASDEELQHARHLRETVYRLVRAVLTGERRRVSDLHELNAWARRPALAPQLGETLEQRWSGGAEEALSVIAREAVELLASSDRLLIRECAAAPACSRIYLDRSPGRRRRWCHMQWCGSTAKMRAYRRRQTAAEDRSTG